MKLVLALFLFFTASGLAQPGPFKEGYLSAGNLRIYYRQQGNGPAVVLLHAGLQNSSMWQSQITALSKTHKVISLDLPFHGRTTGVDTTLLAADIIKTVADSLGLQKLSLVGLSMGASVAQDFVIAYPERVDKLVLMATGINGYERQHPIDSVSMFGTINTRKPWKQKTRLRQQKSLPWPGPKASIKMES